jgi:uncharacterized protein (TIGR02246 family)
VEALTPIGDAVADIDRSRLAFASALGAGDAEAAAAIYADDATLLAPAADVLHGRPAIERFWRTGVETGIEQVELVVIDLQQRGDVVFEVGRYALHVAPETGAPVVDRGRYLVVHRVEADGRWRRAAEMFSPDTGPGSPGALDAATRPRA